MAARTERVQEGDGLKGEYMVRNCGCSGWILKLWSQSKRKEEKKRTSSFAGGFGEALSVCVSVFPGEWC